MLPKPIEEKIIEIFAARGEEEKREAMADPEACLLSLLKSIQVALGERPDPTTDWTVMVATFEPNQTEAKQQLARSAAHAGRRR